MQSPPLALLREDRGRTRGTGLADQRAQQNNERADNSGRLMQPLAFSLFTNGDDAANHSDGHDTNHSGGRDRRNGPTHGHGRVRVRGRL